MSHVYKVEVNGAYHAYVEAESTTEAKRLALENVIVTRLGAGEVIDLVQAGVAIQRGSGKPAAEAQGAEEDQA